MIDRYFISQIVQTLKQDLLPDYIMNGSRRVHALALVLLMILGSTAAPASAQANDPKQPSVQNPHMHFWGTSQMDQCWTHFDRNGSDGSSNSGYGEKEFTGNGQQVDVDFTCRIQSGETFKNNMYLDANSSIVIELEFQIQHTDCNDNNEQQECQDLTLTLFKGTTPVASDSFPQIGGSDADENLRWEIPVANNMTTWNKSGEEPSLQIEFSKPGYSSAFGCSLFLCGGWFRFYYSNNEDNYSVEANFPIVNLTQQGEGGDDDEGGIGGAVSDTLPGFGLSVGLGALALAAVAGSRSKREE